MYKLSAICTYSYLFTASQAIRTANSKSLQDWLDAPNTAGQVLTNNYRTGRSNSGFFEEVKAGNYRRECQEEKCTFEELSEIVTDEDVKNNLWKDLTENCKVAPLCSGEGTSLCIQTWNKKKCICNDGFTGEFCENDIDECDASAEGFVEKCTGVGQSCKNFIGGFTCGCNDGFEEVGGLGTDEDFTCQDIDECSTRKHNCGRDDLCKNTVGTYFCDEDEVDVTPEPTESPTTSVPPTNSPLTDPVNSETTPFEEDEDFTEEGSTIDPNPEEVEIDPIPKFTQATPITEKPVTEEYVDRFVGKQCGASNPCNYNDGKGGCMQQCVPLCDEDCDCTYQCKCNFGYVLSCDYKSCVAV